MAATSISRGRLRRLADFRPEKGRVLSVFIDLDPSQFATAAARAAQISSVVNEARRRIDEQGGELDHETRMGLRDDAERIEELLDPTGLGQGGIRGLAIYACAPADFLEVVRLPYPIGSRVEIDDSPFIEPLALVDERERWCVVLASRRNGRILVGDEDGLTEIERVDDDVAGQHDQGGWSQARYQRSVDKEKDDHIGHVAEEAFRTFRFRPFDRLLIGAPEPLDGELEARLHPYLKERLAGRVQVDVDNSGPADVLAAARPVFEQQRRRREEAALERLRAGLGRPDGRAAAGTEDVAAALEQQRVETLMIAADRDGERFEEAIERAIEQSADILVVRDGSDLEAHGGIAALLRF